MKILCNCLNRIRSPETGKGERAIFTISFVSALEYSDVLNTMRGHVRYFRTFVNYVERTVNKWSMEKHIPKANHTESGTE